MELINTPPAPGLESLEQLLCRQDIWRGAARLGVAQRVVDAGFAPLNEVLLNGGWPRSSLIEVCQHGGGFHPGVSTQAEWLLLSSALLTVGKGLVVLLNPPYQPFAQTLIQQGMDLERVLVVETNNKADFLASFIELTRSQACDAVLAWQPKQALNYTDLRKCLLAANDGSGLYWIFRPGAAQQQSSPAALRIAILLQERALQVTVFKQKGELKSLSKPIVLPLPESWNGLLPHHQLDQIGKPQPKVASVTPLHGGRLGPK